MIPSDLTEKEEQLLLTSLTESLKSHQLNEEKKKEELGEIAKAMDEVKALIAKISGNTNNFRPIPTKVRQADENKVQQAEEGGPEYKWRDEIRTYLSSISSTGNGTSVDIGEWIVRRDGITDIERQKDIKNRFSGTCSTMYAKKKLERVYLEDSDEYLYNLPKGA